MFHNYSQNIRQYSHFVSIRIFNEMTLSYGLESQLREEITHGLGNNILCIHSYIGNTVITYHDI